MVKILFLAANPKETTWLRSDEESNQIESRLRQADLRDSFEVKVHLAVRADEIPGLLLRHRPALVHFSGHGSRESEIVLNDERGNAQPVGALGDLFSAFNHVVRCVVLNSCYSEPQARAIAEHVECVVGMARPFSDDAAVSFAATFYEMLGYGRSVGSAFEVARWVVRAKGRGEEHTPQLVSPHADPDAVVLATAREDEPRGELGELERSLAEGTDAERLTAAQRLWAAGRFELTANKSLTALIVERSFGDYLPGVRHWLNRALGKIGTSAAVEVLRENVKDPDVYAALGAEDALAELGRETA